MASESPVETTYRFTVDRKSGYLHASATGQNTSANVRRILQDVMSACAEHSCPRALIEEHLIGPSIGMLDAFEIVAESSRSARPAVELVAYVDTNSEHDSTLLDFAETVAVNRGVRVRVFGTVAEAEAWLATLPPL